MGYAKEGQNTKGIHMRLFSRAFIFDDGWKRSVFVSVDCGMIDQLLKIEVKLILDERGKWCCEAAVQLVLIDSYSAVRIHSFAVFKLPPNCIEKTKIKKR